MQAEVIIYGIIFLYGIVIGSFLNVLIYRLPLKENIATDRSHCMKCQSQIKWYDLIPVASYIILKGKCRNCAEKISIQYPLIELLNGCGYVLIVAILGFNWTNILACLLFSILIVITVIDCRIYEIPVGLNISIAVLAIIKIVFERGTLSESLIGACTVSGFLIIVLLVGRKFFDVEAIGGGDIKLMAVAGLFLGYKNIILAFLIGCISGAIIHSILIKTKGKDRVLAFGPYLSLGIFIAMLFGDEIINWYMGLLL